MNPRPISIVAPLTAMFVMLQAAAPQERPELAFDKGRVSARVRNAPVRTVLEELARQTGVGIFAADEIGDDSISVELQDIPLEDALRTVLTAYDAFFYYQAGAAGTHTLRSVWVYPMGAAKSLRPVPPQVWAGSRELESNLSDADPQIRAKAYEVLMDRPDGRSRELLRQALRGRETDEAVRQLVLSSAIAKGLEVSPAIFAELARTDGSEQIRWMALDALSHLESAREVAESLKMDSSEAVRQRAMQILAELNAADRRRERPAASPEPDR